MSSSLNPTTYSMHDIGRLCLDLAAAAKEKDMVQMALSFIQQVAHGMDAFGMYLFDQEHSPYKCAIWPETSEGELAQVMDECIDNGAMAQAMRHGRASVELPDYARVSVQVIATRGRDIGLCLALQRQGDPLETVHLDEIIATVLAILAQSLGNARMHEQAISHREALQHAVDERTKDLAVALQQSQSAERAKSIFLATMSHEIRTPMSGVLGVLDLLARGVAEGPPDDYGELVHTAQRSGQHLLALLNDILDLAKMDAGHTVVQSKPFNVVECIEGVIASLASHEKVRSQALRLRVDNQLSSSSCRLGDSLHLRQILFNLCGNALKFTDTGEVVVHLSEVFEAADADSAESTVSDDADQSILVIRVSDTGVGISSEDISTLFDPFQQVERQRQEGGTGLGLAISQRLCTLMGGSLSVESALGKGSDFICRLPLAPCPSGTVSVEKTDHEPGKRAFPGLRVLCAEDNAVNRLVVKRLLEALGCMVVVANNGEHAWQLYQQGSPDVIITDIEMPVMNGYQLAEQVRAHEVDTDGAPTPIVALSAHSYVEHKQHADLSGFDAFVAKPVVMDDLRQALAELFPATAIDQV